ncbi:MAG: phosphatidylinositol-specific phospholipase C/glycerophosphodiester phosphodiesterase family protein [Saprospiraceae bacterium]
MNYCSQNTILNMVLVSVIAASSLMAQVVPLPNAHAHNDYEHNRPLLDALDQGFTSVEADVFLVDDRLVVTHNLPHQAAERQALPTLEELYLQPLLERVKENDGVVFPGYTRPFYLMIDFKSAAKETYSVLLKTLESFQEMLHTAHHNGPVTIFISGNRPIEQILADPEIIVGLDGRPDDLQRSISPDRMPVVSISFGTIGSWDGQTLMPRKMRKAIQQLAKACHVQGKKLRLWAIPDTKLSWSTMLRLGVDLINTDDLEGLSRLLGGRN